MRTTTERGGAAGAVGVVAMDAVTWLLYRRESRLDLLREKRARRDGKDRAHALVRRVGEAVGTDAGSSESNGAGIAVHYALGMGPGAVYAEQRGKRPWPRRGNGALHGAGPYVANDLLAARLVRIAGPQGSYPWQAHARGIVGRLVTETALNAMDDHSGTAGSPS